VNRGFLAGEAGAEPHDNVADLDPRTSGREMAASSEALALAQSGRIPGSDRSVQDLGVEGINLAILAMEMGRWSESARLYRDIAPRAARADQISSFGRDARLSYFLRAVLLQREGRHGEAVEAFQRSLFSRAVAP
jgi:hypothetical protein